MTDLLEYYTTQSPLSDPGPYANLYDPLPDDPKDLAAVVNGLLLHKLGIRQYNLTLSSAQRAEQRLRSIEQRLAKMVEVDPSPLSEPRQPSQRQVSVCRDFALLYTSMLRHKRIPARMRVGFANYLDPKSSYSIDHWITEFWDFDKAAWILTDPDLTDIHWEKIGVSPGTLTLRRPKDFYLAGDAWQLCRDGKMNPLLFRFNGQWKGMPCIRGNMLHDFQALNKLELSVFDYWDELSYKSESNLNVGDKQLLDHIAELTTDPDARFEEMRQFFEDLPRTHRIRSKLRMLGYLGESEMADPAHLRPSGIEQLSSLSEGAESTSGSAHIADQAYPGYDLPDDHPAFYQSTLSAGAGDIIVRGARQHNLKNIDVRIPRGKMVVVTGVSGSGKSSLAFDTIYAEGQRRYVESLSSYARQFMDQMEKPQVDQITGLSPAIAIEQKTISRNPRSTVGTVTEILDYLRVLFARIGITHCPQCGRAVQPQSAQQITNQIAKLPAGTRFQLLAPIVRSRKGSYVNTLKKALRDGYVRARIDGELIELSDSLPELDRNARHSIELVVDRLVVPGSDSISVGIEAEFHTRLMDSVETTLKAGSGLLVVLLADDGREFMLSEHNACPDCDISFPSLEPHLFSFNSPLGMCDECNGLGVKLQVDPHRIIVNPNISLLDGASAWHGNLRKKPESSWGPRVLGQLARHYDVDLELPWVDLPEDFRNAYLNGSGGEKIHWEFERSDGSFRGEAFREARGAVHHINRLFRQTKSEGSRRYYMQFMSRMPCPKCTGERLCPEARYVTVDGKRLPELTSWSIESIHEWVSGMMEHISDEQRQIGQELIGEISERLGFIRNVGLHYLTLDRPAPTLSGGEGQRIRLASQIGSGLVGVLYILDEPSIGLHNRDHRALLDTLIHLRNIGNTILVVEHDETTMRTADWIIDLGPGPGILGGELVAAGMPAEIMMIDESLTGKYLSGELNVVAPNGRKRREPSGWLTLKNAHLHNLKNIDANFPLGSMICVTGVSGSGKSSLISQTLHPALARTLHNAQSSPGPHDDIEGLEHVDKIINITQDPIGRNPRSNPGTYVGVLSEIRNVFAMTPESQGLGYKPGRFSFNVKGGRCESCSGYGYKKVEMHFLPDVWVKCAECGGMRFNRQTLAITYKDKNIADILDMDVQQALEFFTNHPKIKRTLQTLHDVGLDYIKLGQSALTLSGGEAQRVKLAKELSRVSTGRTIYLLDEPTTGLHFADIQRLLDVLHRLVNAGNTVIVIEHNKDVIKTADWIIDLGPEGGDKGGHIVAEGAPEEISRVEASYTGQFLREIL